MTNRKHKESYGVRASAALTSGHWRGVALLWLVLLFALAGSLSAQTVPSTGSIGFLISTSYTDPTNQPGAAMLGVINFNGGSVSGPYLLEYGSGGPLPVTTTGAFSGTYTSAADGIGTINISLDNGVALTLAMVMTDGGRGLQLAATSCSGGFDLAASVVGGIGVHANRSTTGGVAALNGSYGGQFTYSPQPSRFPFIASFDGAGNVTLSGTFVGAGPSLQSLVYPGTYTLNGKGMGIITLAPQSGQAAQTFHFVVTNEGGPGLLILQTDRLGNGVSLGTAHLQ